MTVPRKRSTQPTEVELEILRALWDLGPSTVRQVHCSLVGSLAGRRQTGYSTTLKMMQVMRDKGLLVRDDTARPQRYRPAAPPEQTQLQLIDHLVDRAFGGSARRLLLRAVEARRVSARELAEMQRVIEQAEAVADSDSIAGTDAVAGTDAATDPPAAPDAVVSPDQDVPLAHTPACAAAAVVRGGEGRCA